MRVQDKVPLVSELLLVKQSFVVLCQICVNACMLVFVNTWVGCLRSGFAGVCHVCYSAYLYVCACLYVRQSVRSAVGVVRLRVCLTLAIVCCRRGPAEAR